MAGCFHCVAGNAIPNELREKVKFFYYISGDYIVTPLYQSMEDISSLETDGH
jgi:hypothetical protein